MSVTDDLPEIALDAANLYREEQITDLRAGTIRRLIPITAEGADDSARDVIYEGGTTLMTPAGTLPINFLIEADSLADALAKFPEAAKAGIENTMEELQKLRREQQSSIVVPGQGGQGGVPGGGMPGGGGKIQL